MHDVLNLKFSLNGSNMRLILLVGSFEQDVLRVCSIVPEMPCTGRSVQFRMNDMRQTFTTSKIKLKKTRDKLSNLPVMSVCSETPNRECHAAKLFLPHTDR